MEENNLDPNLDPNTPAAGDAGNAPEGAPPQPAAKTLLSADGGDDTGNGTKADPVTLTLPGDDASDEERNAFYSALGRPDSADGYNVAAPEDLPEGLSWNEEQAKAFAQAAFDAGLSGKQFDAALNFHTELVKKQYAAALEAHNAAADTAEANLKKEFGDKYESVIAQANKALTHFGLGKTFADAGLLANEQVIRAMYRIGSAISETKIIGAKYSNINNAQARYDELMKPDSPYYNANDPKHAEAVREVRDLLRILDKTAAR